MRGVEERVVLFLYVAATSDEDNAADGLIEQPAQEKAVLRQNTITRLCQTVYRFFNGLQLYYVDRYHVRGLQYLVHEPLGDRGVNAPDRYGLAARDRAPEVEPGDVPVVGGKESPDVADDARLCLVLQEG